MDGGDTTVIYTVAGADVYTAAVGCFDPDRLFLVRPAILSQLFIPVFLAIILLINRLNGFCRNELFLDITYPIQRFTFQPVTLFSNHFNLIPSVQVFNPGLAGAGAGAEIYLVGSDIPDHGFCHRHNSLPFVLCAWAFYRSTGAIIYILQLAPILPFP